MRNQFNTWRAQPWPFNLLALAGVVLILTACGVKTNPVPPNIAPPPAVTGMTGSLEQGRANLAWAIPLEGPRGTAPISGFRVLRAKLPLKDEPCEDCIPRFVQVRDMGLYPGVGDQPQGQEMSYSEKLDPGFEYRFKVVTYSENGIEGGDSNSVVLQFKD
ncbi:MAG: hypothetical protein WBG37_07075 [Desulfobacterales bacterium]